MRKTANETVVIDILAKFVDQTSDELKAINQQIHALGNAFKGPKGEADKLGDSLKKTKQQADKLTRDKWTMKLDMIDKASGKLKNVTSSIYGFAGKTFKFGVSIIDYATRPLRGILGFATSLQGILTGLAAGQAMQTGMMQPIGLADSYSNAYIGFKTLFRDEGRAQKMMDDLDTFAKETPFKTSNVISQSQKMLAMGWSSESLLKDMETIGNAASATGRGDEGLDRIVLALAQIKSKGKLSTEELNQLAEAGINAKAYIAEGLGYGRSDEGLQQLASDLQKGAIGGNAAVEMILEGMKEYDGMMKTLANETASGIMSNIQDTFEISIIRKWGKGLQDGAIKGLKTFADFLDKNEDKLNKLGDTVQGVAEKISGRFADAAEFITEKILEVTESAEFQDADLGGKMKILWDEIIGKPFDDWWSKNSKGMAEKIGGGLGSGLNGIITGIFGLESDGIAGEASSFGGTFAKSFLEGFKPKEVGKAIWDGLKNAFDNAPGWAKMLMGGFAVKKGVDFAVPAIQTGTSVIRDGMDLWGGAKQWLFGSQGGGVSNTLPDMGETVSPYNIEKYWKAKNAAKAQRKEIRSLGKAFKEADIDYKLKEADFNSLYRDYTEAKSSGADTSALSEMKNRLDVRRNAMNHAASNRQGLLGAKEAAEAKYTGLKRSVAYSSAGLSSTAATALTVGGWIIGALGLVDAGKEIAEGFDSKSKKQSRDHYVTGATKAGMVATGAGIGALIGSIIPGIGTAVGGAIGAGIGGIGALTGGNGLGQWASDSLDGTRQIREATDNLIGAREAFTASIQKDMSANALIDEYERLRSLLYDTTLPIEERKQLENEIKGVVQELANLFPGLISQYDVLNGRVSTNLETLKEISALERERARWDLEKEVRDARKTFEKKDVAGKLEESDKELAANKRQAQRIDKAINDAAPLMAEYDRLVLKVENDPAYAQTKEYAQKSEELRSNINKVADRAGFHYNGPLSAFRENFVEDANEKRGQYIDAIQAEQARNDELRNTYNEVFKAEKALIENKAGLNGSIEDAAANFDKLDAAQRDAFKDAIDQVLILQEEFDNLPKELEIPVNIYAATHSRAINEKWDQSKENIQQNMAQLGIFSSSMIEAAQNGNDTPQYANGGIITKPHMGLVGEAGPEAIIPLSGGKRGRGLSLWEKAGRALGVLPYADGGIVGSQSYTPQTVSYSADNSAAGVAINMGGLNFSFEGVDVRNPENVIQAIRAQMPQVANELCQMIANLIPKSFGNMA